MNKMEKFVVDNFTAAQEVEINWQDNGKKIWTLDGIHLAHPYKIADNQNSYRQYAAQDNTCLLLSLKSTKPGCILVLDCDDSIAAGFVREECLKAGINPLYEQSISALHGRKDVSCGHFWFKATLETINKINGRKSMRDVIAGFQGSGEIFTQADKDNVLLCTFAGDDRWLNISLDDLPQFEDAFVLEEPKAKHTTKDFYAEGENRNNAILSHISTEFIKDKKLTEEELYNKALDFNKRHCAEGKSEVDIMNLLLQYKSSRDLQRASKGELKLLRFNDSFLDTATGAIISRTVALPVLKRILGKEGCNEFLALPFDDPHSPYIHNFTFNPARPYGVIRKDKVNYWNTYKGFLEDTTKRGDITPILNHLQYVVCNPELNGPLAYAYVINWLAHLIQKPEEKPRVALAVYSKAQQTGKGIIFKTLMGKILGNMLKTTSNSDDIFGTFNGYMCFGSLLTVLDEIEYTNKSEKGKVNNIITESIINMNKKNLPPVMEPTYNRVVQLTNSDWIQSVSAEDSRWVMLECSAATRDNKEYFKTLANCIDNCWYSFYEYLMSIDISNFDPQANRVITKTLLNQIELNQDVVEIFTAQLVNNQIELNWDLHVPTDGSYSQMIKATDLYKIFDGWYVSEKWGKGGEVSRSKFGIKMTNNKKYVKKIKTSLGNFYQLRKI